MSLHSQETHFLLLLLCVFSSLKRLKKTCNFVEYMRLWLRQGNKLVHKQNEIMKASFLLFFWFPFLPVKAMAPLYHNWNLKCFYLEQMTWFLHWSWLLPCMGPFLLFLLVPFHTSSDSILILLISISAPSVAVAVSKFNFHHIWITDIIHSHLFDYKYTFYFLFFPFFTLYFLFFLFSYVITLYFYNF